jgi:hypothetical protein
MYGNPAIRGYAARVSIIPVTWRALHASALAT